MPYIKPEKRNVPLNRASDMGDYNYHLTLLINRYLEDRGLSYQSLFDVVKVLGMIQLGKNGLIHHALEGFQEDVEDLLGPLYEDDKVATIEMVKLELYRRLGSPYETLKIGQNGDVYSEKLKEGLRDDLDALAKL